MKRRWTAGRPRPLLPAATAAVAAAVVCITVFMPWYTPDLAQPLAPDAVSGWDATAAARIAFAGAVLCLLCGLAIAMDARRMVALDDGGIALLSIMAVVGAVVGVVAVGYRTAVVPEPSAELSRQLGLYLAAIFALVALGAALVQLLLSNSRPRLIRRG
ncbi:MAG: hypothetical protein U0Y82_11420 [Thermoleophilia bacterium]